MGTDCESREQTQAEIYDMTGEFPAKDVQKKVDASEPIDENAAIRASFEASQALQDQDQINHNERILALHQQGLSNVEIARELGLGLGEVKLVIGLFKGEETIEV